MAKIRKDKKLRHLGFAIASVVIVIIFRNLLGSSIESTELTVIFIGILILLEIFEMKDYIINKKNATTK